MEKEGLVKSDFYLSAARTVSYVKLPPSTFRRNPHLVNLFRMLGPSLTMNIYEKMFETFGLMTASDATVVPLTSTGVQFLRENKSFVDFYHCLDKDIAVKQMIQERILANELRVVRQHRDAPCRYEFVIEKEEILHLSKNDTENTAAGKMKTIDLLCY